MRIKSVLYIALLTLSTVALLLSLSIIPFAILPIMITAASILTISFAYPWIIGAAGADVNAADQDLNWAAARGHTKIALALIEKGADVNAKDGIGKTPLHSAAICGRTETAVALIEKGADINATDRYGRTPLHRAAEKGCTETAVALIEKDADVNSTDQYGDTPLHNAAVYGHTAIAIALINAGADVNGRTETAIALINTGADVNRYGATPLHLAAYAGRTETVLALIAKGADKDAKPYIAYKNETAHAIGHPLHYAARLCDVKTVKVFIDKGYCVQAMCNDDKTPLKHAIEAGNLNVAMYLIALTKPNLLSMINPNKNTANHINDMYKLATSEHNASALTVGSHATQDQLSKRIQNSKIDFAKALFGMPTTDKAKAMVKFMMFNLTFKIKGSYRDAIVIARDLDKSGTTDKGKIRPSLCPDVIGIILNFAGLMPGGTSIDAIAHPYYKALNSSQITSIETAAKHPTLPNTTTANPGPGRPAAAA